MSSPKVFWLWRNGDHWVAYDDFYPTRPGSADPATLGDPEFVVLEFGSYPFDRSGRPTQAPHP